MRLCLQTTSYIWFLFFNIRNWSSFCLANIASVVVKEINFIYRIRNSKMIYGIFVTFDKIRKRWIRLKYDQNIDNF